MHFEWDEKKNQQNLKKHDVGFETAALVFEDPHLLTEHDLSIEGEERWSTLGSIAPGVVLFVAHTWFEQEGEEVIPLFQLARQNPVRGGVMSKLSKEQRRDIAAIAAKRDEDIDFSDIPLKMDWNRAEIGKFYRPPKKSVTMRLDEDILEWIKGFGPGYQTRVNHLLRHAMANTVAARKKAKRA